MKLRKFLETHYLFRFKDGKLVTQRNWKVLSPLENRYTAFQQGEIAKAQGIRLDLCQVCHAIKNKKGGKHHYFAQ